MTYGINLLNISQKSTLKGFKQFYGFHLNNNLEEYI